MSQTDGGDADKSEFRTNITLITRARDRTDVDGWSQFYKFYQPLIMRYLRRLGLEENTANDVIQDVFVRLLQSLPTFELDRKRGRFRSYLWKLTYTALVDQARRSKTRQHAEAEWVKRFLSDDVAESEKVHQELNEINYQEILAKALPHVRSITSATAWSCFEQRLLRDRPGSEIAAELGISDKVVFVYASRVLKSVRKQCSAVALEMETETLDRLLQRQV